MCYSAVLALQCIWNFNDVFMTIKYNYKVEPLLFSANVDIYWKNYETGKGRIDELSNIKEVVFGTRNK